MTPNSRKILKTSGALIAVSMLGACNSMPRSGGEVIDTLGDVGAKTIELGSRAVEGAKDFLHLHPEGSRGGSQGQIAQAGAGSDILQTEALDGEIDMALMESETTLLDGDTEVVVQAAGSNMVIKQPLEDSLSNDLALNTDSMLTDPALDELDNTLQSETTLAMATPDPLAIDPLANPDPLAPAATPAPAATNAQSVATSDLIHEVQEQENLWDIAKTTTGDANNWHVLADINNLAPNASVFPGQQLTIPADMIKPGYLTMPTAKTTAAPASEPAAAKVVTAASDNQRLVIPEEGVQEELQANNEASDSINTPKMDIAAGAKQFKLGPGETLWNFAKRTTGDATNWKAIAAQNNFSEKQAVTVYPGQSIYVPNTIVKKLDAELENSAVAAAAPAKKAVEAEETVAATAAAVNINDTDTDALEAAAAVLASTESILDDSQPIKIVEAKFQEEPTTAVAPKIETETLAAEANQQLETNAGQQIMVSGTYYPKAIYNEADFSSSLLMRVSPGTQLSVSKAVGPWYQVMTDKGVGYVHARDIR